MVSGWCEIDPVAAVQTTVGLTLPIASNLATADQCCGTANSLSPATAGIIEADTTNNTAVIDFIASGTGNHFVYFSFSYLIV
jgi:hypothetical protein